MRKKIITFFLSKATDDQIFSELFSRGYSETKVSYTIDGITQKDMKMVSRHKIGGKKK